MSLRLPSPTDTVPHSGPVSAASVRPVTNGSQTIANVDVSRDGRWLAFAWDRGGNLDIYKMATGGGEAIRLTTDSAADFAPAWSADGRQIVFHSMRTGNRDIFTMNADGSGLRQRTSTTTEDLVCSCQPTPACDRRSSLGEWCGGRPGHPGRRHPTLADPSRTRHLATR